MAPMKRVNSGLLRSFAGDWLTELSQCDPTTTPVLKLSAMNKILKGPDIESLPALLRSLRWCKSMVVAQVPADLTQLSMADLLLCILADRVHADVVDLPIQWAEDQPALEKFVMLLWEGAAGAVMAALKKRPKSLQDLKDVGMVIGADELARLESSPKCTQPEFLVGLRRMGVLQVGKMDKMSFNFYWVAKVLRLNSLPEMVGTEMRGAAAGAMVDAARQPATADESMKVELGEDGTLHLELRANVLNMRVDEIWRTVIPHIRGARRVAILLPGDEPGVMAQLLPGEVLGGRSTIYKWYRKWDLLLGKLIDIGPVACELRGPCPPLLVEVFFAADAKAWAYPNARVGFDYAGYMPGSSACRILSHAGRACQRALLLGGLSLDAAIRLGVVSELSLATTTGADPGLLPMLLAQAQARRQNWPSTISKPLCDVLQLLQALPNASSLAGTRLSARPSLAAIIGVSCTLPEEPHQLHQLDVSRRLELDGTPLHGLFEAEHVETRTLAELATDAMAERSCTPQVSLRPGAVPGQGELTEKHLRWARGLLLEAVSAACRDAEVELHEVGSITVCTSTGYLLPGLSAYVVHDLGLPMGTARFDIVGMGCHAGLNSLQCATNWAHANPGKVALSCGVEVCSAGFIWPEHAAAADGAAAAGGKEAQAAAQKLRMNHAVVNSLFADGCFCAVLFCPPAGCPLPPNYATLHEFASLTATAALDTMVYKWSDEYRQFWFYLSEDAPYAVGGALFALLHDCQARGVPMESVRHWVMHTGGQTVVDAATASLGLDLPELEPTVRALKRYGNQSSTSFMFAFSEFINSPPSPVSPGDLGAFLTMGPGAGFEFCLWSAGARTASHAWAPLSGWVPGNLLPIGSKLVRRVADPPHRLSQHPKGTL